MYDVHTLICNILDVAKLLRLGCMDGWFLLLLLTDDWMNCGIVRGGRGVPRTSRRGARRDGDDDDDARDAGGRARMAFATTLVVAAPVVVVVVVARDCGWCRWCRWVVGAGG